ncbi:MAG: SPOR domain-containing protein [Gammaproteobacteria bacterium]|nr:SPOR domain-containing protein [Gammaproteobacteria bacterium]
MKHRIVGSLMLLSAAAIILPFWLDGAGLEEYQSTNPQPMMPDADELVIVETLDPVDPSDPSIIELSPILAVDDQPDAITATPTVAAKPKPAPSLLNAQGLPNGWVVQLGNFGNQSNAVRLKDKVIKAGFAAYMIPNGTLFKVLVGPELTRAKAESLQKKLKDKFKMAGYVTLYKVENP